MCADERLTPDELGVIGYLKIAHPRPWVAFGARILRYALPEGGMIFELELDKEEARKSSRYDAERDAVIVSICGRDRHVVCEFCIPLKNMRRTRCVASTWEPEHAIRNESRRRRVCKEWLDRTNAVEPRHKVYARETGYTRDR